MRARGGPRAVLTAGGTREAVDDVRYLSNVATGGLPARMAEALLARGWDVCYVHGPGAVLPARVVAALDVSAGDGAALDAALAALAADARARAARIARGGGRLTLRPVQSAADARDELAAALAEAPAELVACAMAVADFAPRPIAGKLSSATRGGAGEPALTLALDATAKVIDVVADAAPDAALLGFKLLSGGDEAAHVEASRRLAARSGARWVFSNDMRDYGVGRRCGTLRASDGTALTRLDGGEGQAALERLAEALVDAVLREAGFASGAS